jgi:hypothetical protein
VTVDDSLPVCKIMGTRFAEGPRPGASSWWTSRFHKHVLLLSWWFTDDDDGWHTKVWGLA